MATICIIDDKLEYLDIIEKIITDHYSFENIIKMTSFSFDELNNTIVDLFILDIDMPGINGIDLAILLKKSFPFTDIVFISAHNDFIHTSLQVQPLYFIRKNHLEQDFNTFFQLLDINKYDKKVNIIDRNKVNHYITINSIIYIDIQQHNLTIHLENKDIELYTTLKDILDLINENIIIQIHKSYAVNINNIEKISNDLCFLKNGISLSIGRTYKTQLVNRHKESLI